MKVTEQVKVIERHFNAMGILIEYVSQMASKGDTEAVKVLIKFDKTRGYGE